MKHIAQFLIVIVFLPFVAHAQGAQVELVLSSGTVVSGELVEIGDSTLIVAARAPNRGSAEPGPLLDQTIALGSINRCTVRGKSDIGKAMVMGLGIGAAAGILLGLASGDDNPNGFMSMTAGEKAGFAALGLGAVGILVGLVAGASSTRPAAVITPLPGDTFDALRPYTRVARAARL